MSSKNTDQITASQHVILDSGVAAGGADEVQQA